MTIAVGKQPGNPNMTIVGRGGRVHTEEGWHPVLLSPLVMSCPRFFSISVAHAERIPIRVVWRG